jgi:prepilin-type processing-associated H-X9-DG protein
MWTYQILPYLEQEALHELEATSLTRLRRTPISVYYCPSRRQVRLYQNNAKCDYSGNAGTILDAGANGVIVRILPMTPEPAPTWPSGGTRPPGSILIEDRRQVKVSTAQILDGTSNTLLVGEKRIHRSWMDAGQGGYSSDNEDCYTAGYPDDNGARGLKPPEPDLMLASQLGSLVHEQFGSSHPGSFNAVLCDGSVRSVRFNVSTTVFTAFTIRKDGRAFGPGDL